MRAAVDVDAVVRELEEEGYAIAPGVIEDDLVEEILAELDRLQRERPGGDLPPQPFAGYHTARWFDLLNGGEVWQRVGAHTAVVPVVRGVLGDDCLLSVLGTAVIGPGEEAQMIHCDDGVYGFPLPHRPLVCNTMWALTDFTEENGATRIVPRSHTFGTYPGGATDVETVPAVMPKGSVCFVLGTTWHGAGANRSAAPRPALTINYCDGSMRQQENLMLSVPPDRWASFPTELQDLLGRKPSRFGTGNYLALQKGE